MRLLYTFVLGLLAFGFAGAQNYSISPSKVVNGTVYENGYMELEIKMQNISSSDIEIDWKEVGNTFHSSWSVTFCDNANCYPGVPSSGSMNTVSPGDYGFIKLTIMPMENLASGACSFEIFEPNTSFPPDTVTFNVDAVTNIAGIQKEKDFQVYPVPANDYLIVETGNSETDFIITDISGSVINQLSGPVTRIDLNSYRSGIYFVKHESGLVRKFMVNR